MSAVRKISSDATEFTKVVPAFMVLVFLGLMILVLIFTGHYLIALGPAALWVLVLQGARYESNRLAEEAYLADDHFLLKVNGEEVVIPFRQVKCIYSQRGKKLDFICIGTKSIYPLSVDLRFVPKGRRRLFSAFSDHPLIAELQALVKAARPPAVVIGVDPRTKS
ncbi:hypothetical protein [Chitinimonas sp.]|uniref:hypothetical protein n=1 Tax=Chitinimonas sp. TaxID=1934313 RepID=UPI002F93C71C